MFIIIYMIKKNYDFLNRFLDDIILRFWWIFDILFRITILIINKNFRLAFFFLSQNLFLSNYKG